MDNRADPALYVCRFVPGQRQAMLDAKVAALAGSLLLASAAAQSCGGLVVDGEDGVRDVLSLLHDELDLDMALAGCRSIDEISSDLLKETDISPTDEPVSFDRDIKPLFRERDRGAMKFFVDLWSHDDVARESDTILDRLSDGSMPCDGAWDEQASPCSNNGSTQGNRPETDLLLVALDHLGRPQLSALTTLTGLPPRPPLPQQIPTLIQRHTQRLKPGPVRVRRYPSRFSLPKLVLLGNHPIDRTVNLRILH